jgi:alpha-beta hydrolase superfamily lysophospholipase
MIVVMYESVWYLIDVALSMQNPVSADRIWSDKEVLENQTNPRYLSMGLTAGGLPFRLGTAVQLLTATEKVRSDAIPRLNVPYCAVHGTHDVAVPISGTDFLEEKAMTPAEDRVIHRIEGAYHDLLGEPCAEDTTKYLIAFMEDRLSNKSK